MEGAGKQRGKWCVEKLETLNTKTAIMSMHTHYSPKKLSEKEWRVIEEVLLEEMERQEWFVVTVIERKEFLLILQ